MRLITGLPNECLGVGDKWVFGLALGKVQSGMVKPT